MARISKLIIPTILLLSISSCSLKGLYEEEACNAVTRILQKEGNGIYYGLGRESAKCEELHLGEPMVEENYYPNAMACLDNNLRLRVVVELTDSSVKVSIPPRTYASEAQLAKTPNPSLTQNINFITGQFRITLIIKIF
ncbi:hypothetical protein [uncultured Fibrobacter sp.]|uniref:hypothetical protein n=1 Tax=uncultured Fibrobacter sp. TaxID=261512 RepID=UPI00260206F9|nr:hypothetical protein [uncultured Fibrobacter sp.]